MTTNISTQAVTGAIEDPACIVVDVRAMAAFNGWVLHHEARGGHLPGAVAFPLEWTAVVQGTAFQRLLASKRIMPHKTIVVYDAQQHRSAAMASRLRTLGYPRVLTYDAGVGAWAADARLPLAHLAHYEHLVPPVWVDQLVRGESPATYPGHGFVVFEVGWESPAVYHRGHIPRARYFALEAYEQAPLWTRISDAALEARLLGEGVRYDTTVVLYGRDTTAAARAAVLLLYAGVADVRLLDGGLAAWQAAGYPVVTTTSRPVPVTDFGTMLPGHPEYLLGTEDVQALIAEHDAALVSVRSWAEYIGATSGYRYIQRTGRIAGDVWGHAGAAPLHMDHYRNVDQTMRNYHDIVAQWQAWGVTPDKRVAFYCGTSWRASEAFFYAYLMGWTTIAVYDGGWWAWVQHPAHPIAVGNPSRFRPRKGRVPHSGAPEGSHCVRW